MLNKKIFYILIPVITIICFSVFVWHLQSLSKFMTSEFSYYLNRLIMALWLVIAGFALELQRVWPYLSGKANARTDWKLLLISGIPAFVFAWMPFFVAVIGFPLPDLLNQDYSRLAFQALGAYWLGITLGKSIVLD